jgi:hypothetical protein
MLAQHVKDARGLGYRTIVAASNSAGLHPRSKVGFKIIDAMCDAAHKFRSIEEHRPHPHSARSA